MVLIKGGFESGKKLIFMLPEGETGKEQGRRMGKDTTETLR